MDTKTFETIVEAQFGHCKRVLFNKAKEYGADERLHNFKVAAALKKETPQEALAGMMAKHTVSIFDMCRDEKNYSMEMWNEKITDHINYLLLLKAIIEESIFFEYHPEVTSYYYPE